MDNQPPPLPWPPPADPPPPRGKRCLWMGSAGCVTLGVLLALLVAGIVVLVRFVWDLRLDQWL